MTSPEQLVQDTTDVVVIYVVVWAAVAGLTWWIERRARRRRDRDILPPPIDGRDHNQESIAEYKRKRALIDRTEIKGST